MASLRPACNAARGRLRVRVNAIRKDLIEVAGLLERAVEYYGDDNGRADELAESFIEQAQRFLRVPNSALGRLTDERDKRKARRQAVQTD